MTDNKKTTWSVTDLNSKDKVDFVPIWQEKEDQEIGGLENPADSKKEVECAFIEINAKDIDGKELKMKFNYLDLYGFIYMTGNEELRRQLALRYERKIVYVPYNVSFKIDASEKRKGYAHRRIELHLDEVAMAMVKAKAQLLEGKSPVDSEEELQMWREHKITNLDDQIKEQYEQRKKGGEEARIKEGGQETRQEGTEVVIS